MHVLDQKVQEEVKESGLESMGDVIFEQLMDEVDKQNKDAQEKANSPFDTESEIKFIKSFKVATMPGSLSIHQDKEEHSGDTKNITFLGSGPIGMELEDSDSRLHSMPEDDIVLVDGFDNPDSTNQESNFDHQDTADSTFNASTKVPALSNPIGHLRGELHSLNTKVDQLESSISKTVTDEIKSFIPSVVADSIKEQLPSLLTEALKVCYITEGAEQSAQDKDGQISHKESVQRNGIFKKSSEKTTSEKKDSDDEPPVKKLKFLLPKSSSIILVTPLQSILPQPNQKPDATSMIIDQFTKHLTQTTSFVYSPTPPREPTPPRDESKGKVIATKEPLKDLMPYIKEGGFVPKFPKFKSFISLEEKLTQEIIMAQVKEMKRLADIKAEKEKSKESRKKIMNPANIKARAQKIDEYEAKRAKMLKEYNKCINHRADDLPIIKISYKVSSSHEATMRITRGNDPLNVVIHNKFRLNTLGFSEWLEAQKLGVPPPQELSTFGISADNIKRKRTSELIKEVFVKEDIVVDGMYRT
ncbi:hypothetical protein Tco_1217916 [Tanacetum coccineum]